VLPHDAAPGFLSGGDGVWLRCQLHAHTTNSDGSPSPAELCAHYLGLGFDVLAITDHWHVTGHDLDGLVVVPSSELTARAETPSGEAEVLALGVHDLPEMREAFADIEALAAWIAAHGGVPFLCHPYWSGLRADQILAAPSLAGIEIWNGGSEIQQGNGLSTVHWDDAIQQGRMLLGIATDDCHEPGQDSGFGWTWVQAAERSEAAVLAALRAGRFYASAGPRLLGVEVDDASVVVRSSPVRAIRLRSGPWDGCSVNAEPAAGNWRGVPVEQDADGLLVAARLEHPELHNWARIELEDVDGRRAWGNPFALPV
jgi:hypothetical protein